MLKHYYAYSKVGGKTELLEWFKGVRHLLDRHGIKSYLVKMLSGSYQIWRESKPADYTEPAINKTPTGTGALITKHEYFSTTIIKGKPLCVSRIADAGMSYEQLNKRRPNGSH